MDNQNHRVNVSLSHSQPGKPMPWLRVYTLGAFQIEWVTSEVEQAQPLPDERLSTRGAGPSLALFKALLGCPDRFATRDWLLEQFWPDSSARSAGDRLDDVASALRVLLRPAGSQDKILHFVYGADGRGNGYRLDSYPQLWCDADALAWNVRQAARMERFGDDPLPFWQRAYDLASRGTYLPDHLYEDWAKVRREETRGHLRQVVHALSRLYMERFGTAGEEEALLVLRTYWQAYSTDEDALRQLMELLGKRERFQEALEYYARLETMLTEEESNPDARTQDIAEYLRTKQVQRHQTAQSSSTTQHVLENIALPESVDFEYLPLWLRADFYTSHNKPFSNPIYGVAEQRIIAGEMAALLGQENSMYFDATKRAALKQIVVLLGGILGSHQALTSVEKSAITTQSLHTFDLDLIQNYIEALSALLTKGEAYYVMCASHQLYHQMIREDHSTKDVHYAQIQLQLGFLVAAAQEYALAWYQRDNAVVQTYNSMEKMVFHKFEGSQHFQQAYARLLAKRGRQHRVLWLFDHCEKECEDGLALTSESTDYSLRTHFLCERAHIKATRGHEVIWMDNLDKARMEALEMPPFESKKALHQIDYMQGEGYKRFAFHAQKDFSLTQREQYAQLALEYITQWDGTSIEIPGFESFVAEVSKAQCFILLDPEQAIILAKKQKTVSEKHYPTLLAKIYRILFLAQKRIQMSNEEFVQVFSEPTHIAYQRGANII